MCGVLLLPDGKGFLKAGVNHRALRTAELHTQRGRGGDFYVMCILSQLKKINIKLCRASGPLDFGGF